MQEDIPETGDSLEANAFQKAHYIKKTIIDCFADDTGLEIFELNGTQVFTLRYAGPKKCDANMTKILNELKEENRKANSEPYGTTLNNEEHLFEGEISGHIVM